MNGTTSQIKLALGGLFRMAIIAGVENAVRIHVERGDNLNAQDARGQTPLMLAAARNKPHIFKLLLDAGADPIITDLDGKTALLIAIAADAREIALLLDPAFATPRGTIEPSHKSLLPANALPANDDSSSVAESDQLDGRSSLTSKDTADIVSPPHGIAEWAAPLATLNTDHEKAKGLPTTPILTTVAVLDFDEDGATFDLSGWEPEAGLATPDGDPTVLIAAAEVQNTISEHAPIDISVDWDDFDAFLPENATPLPKATDAETRERLRALLLRATREGSVPNEAIEDLTLNDDLTPNEETRSLLRMVVNDLGAEADERHEYSTQHENFAVYVEPRENPEEEQAVDNALVHIDELQSRRNDPLRLYLREFQNDTLLTADEEIALGKAMEQSVESALDALAESITGIEAIVQAAMLVKGKTKPLRWLSLGARGYDPDAGTEQGASITSKANGAEYSEGDKEWQKDSNEGSPTDELSDFIGNAERLRVTALVLETKTIADTPAVREALGSLKLSGTYLLSLAASGRVAESKPALALRRAMHTYRISRDRMTVANLKLVQSIAKKYLYSGIPLDDLLQEGNIGLLKGVERFDWRRGFKFSTYATWWIRQKVSRYVADKGRTIRVPVHIHEKIQRIEHATRDFEIVHGRAPSISEIAELITLTPHKVATYLQITGEPLPIHELDIDSIIATDVRDEYISPDPMEIVSDRNMSKAVQKILGTLKPIDRNILQMRFGFGASDAMTLDEIGTQMGLTRERIRQIESKILRRLRHPGHLSGLLTALNDRNPPVHSKNNEDDGTLDKAQGKELADAINAITPQGPVERPTFDAGSIQYHTPPDSVSLPLRKLLDAATVLGASVMFNAMSSENTIWVDFSKAPSPAPPTMIHELVTLGFKFWPGKGYWR